MTAAAGLALDGGAMGSAGRGAAVGVGAALVAGAAEGATGGVVGRALRGWPVVGPPGLGWRRVAQGAPLGFVAQAKHGAQLADGSAGGGYRRGGRGRSRGRWIVSHRGGWGDFFLRKLNIAHFLESADSMKHFLPLFCFGLQFACWGC